MVSEIRERLTATAGPDRACCWVAEIGFSPGVHINFDERGNRLTVFREAVAPSRQPARIGRECRKLDDTARKIQNPHNLSAAALDNCQAATPRLQTQREYNGDAATIGRQHQLGYLAAVFRSVGQALGGHCCGK